jgi:uncharacterized membrane protein YedE/YeeE
MLQLLPDRVPWFVGGPLIGLLVVALYALANQRLGVSGAYVQVATFMGRRQGVEIWKVWYFGGLIAGAVLATLLRGGSTVSLEYGALGRAVPLVALIPILFLGGLLMGYGARWAGGCTSGHGLSGTSARSPASFAALAVFMLTAIVVTAILHVVTGGIL